MIRSIIETIIEKLKTTIEKMHHIDEIRSYSLVGPGAYTIYTFKEYLNYLKKADKTQVYHTYAVVDDDDVPTSVSEFDVWDVYFKNGKWISYNEDYGMSLVKDWTLTNDDHVVEIHTEL